MVSLDAFGLAMDLATGKMQLCLPLLSMLSPAKKTLMLGKMVMSKLGAVGSPLVITLVSTTSEVFEVNFWDLLANIFGT